MGMFDGMNQATVSGRGVRLPPGTYEVEIKKVFTKSTQKAGLSVIAEFRVLASDNPAVQVGDEKFSWFQSLAKAMIAKTAIKEFVGAAVGLHGEAINNPSVNYDAIAEAMIGHTNPFAGVRLCVYTFAKKTEAGFDFTVYAWSPSSSAPPGQSQRILSLAGGPPPPVVPPVQASPYPGWVLDPRTGQYVRV